MTVVFLIHRIKGSFSERALPFHTVHVPQYKMLLYRTPLFNKKLFGSLCCTDFVISRPVYPRLIANYRATMGKICEFTGVFHLLN